MKDLNQLMDETGLDKNIEIDEMPTIDLYMDQVIQLFENKFASTKRNDEEKIMTKTMINNYAKGKLFFPVKKKKYTREHLILISLIYQLKGALSISDIKGILDKINEKAVSGKLDLQEFYSSYLNISAQNAALFREELSGRSASVKREMETIKGESGEVETALLIASLVNMSNMYRRMAENLADQLKGDNRHSK